ncbi:MAG: 3-deoxy-manno-octulosonate cytidylyltransferase [Planctomycetota bacterium]
MQADTAILIPARLGSTRMPEKLLRADTGRALITHTVDAAERARALSRGAVAEVLVATDDARIARAVDEYASARGLAARAVLTRPDHACGSDRIAEAARSLPESVGLIINIQGDEPGLLPEHILKVGELLKTHPRADMSTLVRPILDEATFKAPSAVKAVLDRDGYCLYFSRSPIPFDRDRTRPKDAPLGYLHLGIYGFRRGVLLRYKDLPRSDLEERESLEQLRALSAGLRIVASAVDQAGTGIDTEEDYRAFVARLKD